MKGHRQASRAHHRQIIRAVAHGNRLPRGDGQLATGFKQHAALFLAVADIAPGLINQVAGQHAVLNLQHIGPREVDVKQLLHPVGKKGEAAADQQDLQASVFADAYQFGRAWVELESFAKHLIHAGNAHTFKQRHAPAQAVLEVNNFAAHGRFGNGSNFGLSAHCIGDFVDALDVDERRVHVEGYQAEIAQFEVGQGDVDDQAGGVFKRVHRSVCYVFDSD